MIVDTALRKREAEGNPIRVGMVGAGATARAIALQLGTPAPGIRLVAIANRTPEHGERAFREANVTAWSRAGSAQEAESAICRGLPVLTDDPSVIAACNAVDILVEVTGTIGPAADVVLEAFDNGKHVALVNAELDSLLGPILKEKADRAGVVITHTDETIEARAAERSIAGLLQLKPKTPLIHLNQVLFTVGNRPVALCSGW